MSLFSDAEQVARWAPLVFHVPLLLKLYRSGLRHRYAWFSAYLVLRLLRSSVLAALPYGRNIYGWAYVFTEPLLWAFYALVVLELYQAALQRFKGITTLTQWVLTLALGISIVVSLISLGPDVSSSHPYYYVHLSTVIGRAICTSLALFLLIFTAFLVFYPVPLSRNLMIHSIILSVYFLVLAAAYFTHNIFGPPLRPAVNTVLGGITVLALLGWIFLLNPAGERVVVSSRRQWEPEVEQRLVRQLDSINATLLRVARK